MMSILYLFLLLFVLYVIIKYGVKIILLLIGWGLKLSVFAVILFLIYKLFLVSDC
jgi:hypothetical protein